MNSSESKKAFEIGEGTSFKDDWNLRAETLGPDEVAAFGPSSYKLFAEYFGFVVSHRVHALASLTTRDRVLDLGCGPGKLAFWLAPKVHTLLGVDVSDVMLAKAKERCSGIPNLNFLPNDGSDLTAISDASLDVVYSFACFIHLPEDVQRAYESEILRVLRPGGLSLIHVRYNQRLEHVKRTYTGANYDLNRVAELARNPMVKSAELLPIERFDDLVENLDHRRWLLIQRN
jgi:SAM-dependent methyltransferase